MWMRSSIWTSRRTISLTLLLLLGCFVFTHHSERNTANVRWPYSVAESLPNFQRLSVDRQSLCPTPTRPCKMKKSWCVPYEDGNYLPSTHDIPEEDRARCSIAWDNFNATVLSDLRKRGVGKDARILFTIAAHSDSRLTDRLLANLWRPQHSYVVHVDPSNPALLEHLTEKFAEREEYTNVQIINKVCSVRFEWSMVERTLEVLKAGMSSSSDWTHAFVLSESHYPTMSVEDMAALLHAQENFRTCNFVQPFTPAKFQRDWKRHLRSDSVCGVQPDRWQPVGTMSDDCFSKMEGTRASEWVVLSKPFVRFLVSDHPFIQDLVYYSQHYFIPDESFVGDALTLSSFNDTYLQSSLVGLASYLEWPQENDDGHPRLLSAVHDRNMTDFLTNLVQSRTYAFARKFAAKDPLLNVIDEAIAQIELEFQ